MITVTLLVSSFHFICDLTGFLSLFSVTESQRSPHEDSGGEGDPGQLGWGPLCISKTEEGHAADPGLIFGGTIRRIVSHHAS